jgi:hypothetical protein
MRELCAIFILNYINFTILFCFLFCFVDQSRHARRRHAQSPAPLIGAISLGPTGGGDAASVVVVDFERGYSQYPPEKIRCRLSSNPVPNLKMAFKNRKDQR